MDGSYFVTSVLIVEVTDSVTVEQLENITRGSHGKFSRS